MKKLYLIGILCILLCSESKAQTGDDGYSSFEEYAEYEMIIVDTIGRVSLQLGPNEYKRSEEQIKSLLAKADTVLTKLSEIIVRDGKIDWIDLYIQSPDSYPRVSAEYDSDHNITELSMLLPDSLIDEDAITKIYRYGITIPYGTGYADARAYGADLLRTIGILKDQECDEDEIDSIAAVQKFKILQAHRKHKIDPEFLNYAWNRQCLNRLVVIQDPFTREEVQYIPQGINDYGVYGVKPQEVYVIDQYSILLTQGSDFTLIPLDSLTELEVEPKIREYLADHPGIASSEHSKYFDAVKALKEQNNIILDEFFYGVSAKREFEIPLSASQRLLVEKILKARWLAIYCIPRTIRHQSFKMDNICLYDTQTNEIITDFSRIESDEFEVYGMRIGERGTYYLLLSYRGEFLVIPIPDATYATRELKEYFAANPEHSNNDLTKCLDAISHYNKLNEEFREIRSAEIRRIKQNAKDRTKPL